MRDLSALCEKIKIIHSYNVLVIKASSNCARRTQESHKGLLYTYIGQRLYITLRVEIMQI